MRTEDGAIIYKCLNGDREAFAILIDKYKAGIYAYVCAKIKNMDDAEDVTQEVFIRAFRDLQKLRRWDSFAYWLYSIATCQCRNWIRTKSKRPDHNFIEDQDPSKLEKILAEPALESYRDKQMDESLHEALNSLPEIYREVLMLYYMSGMNTEQIANMLAVSPESIRQRLTRARAMLKEEIITMMDRILPQHKLQASFTFRLVEAIKRVKIHPSSQTRNLPLGLSLATGILIAVLSINPAFITFEDTRAPIFAPLPSESKVLKIGEIPVDIIKTSNIMMLSNAMGNGKGGETKKPDMENTFFMAPQVGGGKWERRADMPTAIGYNCFSVVNDKIYSIGGLSIINGKEVSVSTVYEYNPKSDTWSKKADMPTPRTYFGTYVIDGKIYALGGWDMTKRLSTIEEYDPIMDKWVKKADCPMKMSAFAVCQVNGEVYIIGGNDADNVVLKYDPKTDKWTRKSDMPTKRVFLTSCALNNKIYVFGGTSDIGITPLPTTEIYDPSTDTWSKGSDMLKPRWLLSSCAVNGLIYIIGGYLDNVNSNPVIEIYDPAKDKWTEGENLPIARDIMANYPVVNGRIYVIGGCNLNIGYLSDVYEYTPKDWKFQMISQQGKHTSTWGNLKAK